MAISVKSKYITNSNVINFVGELYNLISGIDDSGWNWIVWNIVESEFIMYEVHNVESIDVDNKIDVEIRTKDIIIDLIGIGNISLEARLVI